MSTNPPNIEALQAQFVALVKVNDLANAAKCLGNLGVLYRNEGNFERALECSVTALSLFEKVGDKQSQAAELLLQANTLGKMKDFERAIEAHTRSLKLADELDDVLQVAMNLFRMALILNVMRQYEQARTMLRYAGLLYVTARHDQFFKDVVSVIEQFKSLGAYDNSALSAGLDELFFAGPSAQKIRDVTHRYPTLVTADLIGQFESADNKTIGLQIMVDALRRQGAIIRRIAAKSPHCEP